MRRVLFILAAFVLMAASADRAHAGKFGTEYKYKHLLDLAAKGPKGEALALGYASETHWFFLPYKLTSGYALATKGAAKGLNGRPIDVYDKLAPEKIAQMQRAGTLPNPLPPSSPTIFEYVFATMLWWCIPVTFAVVMLFQALGLGSRTRDETRAA